MKTKKARQEYKCHLCSATITKGEQYARRTFTEGKMTIWAHGPPIPDWAWEPYRVQEPICNACANPKIESK
jgi:hypothetical protein